MECTMSDVLLILQSPLLRIGTGVDRGNGNGNAGVEDEPEDGVGVGLGVGDSQGQGQGQLTSLMKKAKNKVLKQVSKQHMVDTILPVLATLKHVLEEYRSPLQKSCVAYFCVLLKMYKVEMQEVCVCWVCRVCIVCDIVYS